MADFLCRNFTVLVLESCVTFLSISLYIIFLNWYNKAASRRQYNYRGMQEKVTQQVGWVENPTSPQAV
jgi:hypothetical protein